MNIDNIVRILEKEDHIIVEYENGYSASIIPDDCEDGLYEVAVLFDGHLDYTTPITEDVIRYLTEEQVHDVCDRIGELPTKGYQYHS